MKRPRSSSLQLSIDAVRSQIGPSAFPAPPGRAEPPAPSGPPARAIGYVDGCIPIRPKPLLGIHRLPQGHTGRAIPYLSPPDVRLVP